MTSRPDFAKRRIQREGGLNIGAATLFANARRSVRDFKAGFLQRANEEFDILRTG